MKYAGVDMIYQTIPLDKIPWNSESPPTLPDDPHQGLSKLAKLIRIVPHLNKSGPNPDFDSLF